MKRLFQALILCMFAGGLVSCDGDLEVLAEDREAPIRFGEAEVTEIRKGPELGLRVRTRLSGYGEGNPDCLVRCTLFDEEEKAIQNPTLLQTSSVRYETDSSGIETRYVDTFFVEGPSIVFAWPLGKGKDPLLDVFIPYHYLPYVSGDQEVILSMEVLEGASKEIDHKDIPQLISGCEGLDRVGYQKLKYSFYYPDLHSVRVWVHSFSLDTTQFDPHSTDVSLFKIKPDHGFPDICWRVSMDYETVFQSDYYKNSLEGTWNVPSDPIYVDGRAEKIRLCILDHDKKHLFKKRDDALACIDQRILDLSDDPKHPTVFTFEMIKDMKVSVLWDGAPALIE